MSRPHKNSVRQPSLKDFEVKAPTASFFNITHATIFLSCMRHLPELGEPTTANSMDQIFLISAMLLLAARVVPVLR